MVFLSSTSSHHLKYLDFFRKGAHGTWQMYNGTHIHNVTDLSSRLPARNCTHVSSSSFTTSLIFRFSLIWDLLLVGKTSIAHILKSHYRAITDINWHTTECDIVASTGIDSWIYAWDLRQSPDRPIFGECRQLLGWSSSRDYLGLSAFKCE